MRTWCDSKRDLHRTDFLEWPSVPPQNGLPRVAIRDLLKAALRHRPDHILLGEIRGGEAFDLLQLLNTGHSGTLSTIHANSAKQRSEERRVGKEVRDRVDAARLKGR